MLTVWVTGQLTAANIVGTIAAVFVAAQAAYFAYWKGTDAEKALNELTSVVKEVTPTPPSDVPPVIPSV